MTGLSAGGERGHHLPGTALDFSASSTDPTLQIGGGVNVTAGGDIGLRVALDYVRVFAEGDGVNVLRFAAGVVFGFGN